MATRKQIAEMIDQLVDDRVEYLERIIASRGPHSPQISIMQHRQQEAELMREEFHRKHDEMFTTKLKL